MISPPRTPLGQWSRGFAIPAFILFGSKPDKHAMNNEPRIRTFADFYPFYLREHAHRVSRRLHFVGTSIALALLIAALLTQVWWLIALAVVQGYAFAWVGHFFFEHNRPATFKYPGFSFVGDWRMWWDIVTRKIPF